MASISSPGIGSGLDVNSIVTQLVQAEAAGPTQQLNTKESSYQAKLSAFGTLSGALSSFQNALKTLGTQSSFQSFSATASDTTIFSATATAKATAGTYGVNVTQLAQAASLATAGQASTTATIGSGTTTTLTFEFGSISGTTFSQDATRTTGTVKIDTTNNSLQGIRDAINAANLGVTATIVSDGSANPNHLVLKSNSTGATSNMKISVSGDATLASMLTYDPAAASNMTPTAVGQDAKLTVNGIAISSAGNTVTGAIEGVTINATKIGSSDLKVARDTSAVTANINAFIKAYNDLNNTMRQLTAVSTAKTSDGSLDTSQSGALIGDSSVRNIQSQIRKMLATPLANSTSSLTTLSQVGISIDKNGVMSVDSTKLSAAMSKNMTDVTALFSSVGTSSDSLVNYTSSTSATQAGTRNLVVTQLATQGKMVGSLDLNTLIANNGPVTIDSSNKDMTVTINGVTTSVSLTPGTYGTASQLAAQVQSAINSTSAFSSAGLAVSVSIDSAGNMNVVSNTYGSVSKVSIGGSAATALLGSSPNSTDGVDVAGTVGDVAAGGSGQFLTSSDGLKVEVTGGNLGARGSVGFSQGFTFGLSGVIDQYIGSNGLIPGLTKNMQDGIAAVTKDRDALQQRLADLQARYMKQYTALDVAMGQMKTTSTYLTQQLASINASGK
jgi:flagellar hook-associated protein 2